MGFPTETVFGIAAAGNNDDAVAKLFAAKRRDDAKALAHYVNSLGDATRFLVETPPAAVRLARALWPGPLTLVMESGDTTLGFRCSSHPFVSALVSAAGFPFKGTSANISGEAPLTTAAAIAETFAEEVELVIDPGPEAGMGVASTVLLLRRDGGYEILREGAVSPDVIRSELAVRILFVCTGNTCRSPLAAALMDDRLKERGVDAEVYSAGVSAFDGVPASENSAHIAREMGLDLSLHRARSVTDELLQRMDHVIAMTPSHRDALEARFPSSLPDVTVLGENEGGIADPFGGSLELYRECARAMARHLDPVVESLS